MKLWIILLAALSPAAIAAATPSCSLPPPQALGNGTLLWQVPDAPVFSSEELPAMPAYQNFRARALRLPYLDDPKTRIENDLNAHLKNADEPLAEKQYVQSDLGAVLSRRVGQLGRIECLEALLMGEANQRASMWVHPYEMAAVVLRRPGNKDAADLRIYLLFGDSVSADPDKLLPRLRADLSAGWKVEENLHSHPFFPNDTYGVGGYTAPSQPDVELYRRWAKDLGLETAAITNGIYSFRMPTSDLGLLP